MGCRSRADKSELLRVVAVEGACVPDPRGRLAGRGAYVHPDPDCLDLAVRRRAFGRALRLAAVPGVDAVREHLAQQQHSTTRPANDGRGEHGSGMITA